MPIQQPEKVDDSGNGFCFAFLISGKSVFSAASKRSGLTLGESQLLPNAGEIGSLRGIDAFTESEPLSFLLWIEYRKTVVTMIAEGSMNARGKGNALIAFFRLANGIDKCSFAAKRAGQIMPFRFHVIAP